MPKIVDREEMQGKILDAAMAVYTDVGFHAATISAIAKQSGLGKGTLYLYFDSKEALTVALVERIFAGMETSFIADEPQNTLAEFLDHLRATMDIPKEHASFVRVFFEVFGPSFASDEFVERIAGFFDRLGKSYAEQISRLQDLGEIDQAIDASVAGRALAGLVDGMILHRGLFGIPVRRHRLMIDEALLMLGTGLRSNKLRK